MTSRFIHRGFITRLTISALFVALFSAAVFTRPAPTQQPKQVSTPKAMPDEPAASDNQQLTAEQRQQKKLGCINVSRRWQVCGDTDFKKKFVAGVGIRFNKIDPNGKIVASHSYKDCAELAADRAIPEDIRKKAAQPCRQSLQLAASQASVK